MSHQVSSQIASLPMSTSHVSLDGPDFSHDVLHATFILTTKLFVIFSILDKSADLTLETISVGADSTEVKFKGHSGESVGFVESEVGLWRLRLVGGDNGGDIDERGGFAESRRLSCLRWD